MSRESLNRRPVMEGDNLPTTKRHKALTAAQKLDDGMADAEMYTSSAIGELTA